MDRIPKYTADLLRHLDADTPRVEMGGYSAADWGALTEGQLRAMAYRAGMRALVDELLEWSREETDAEGDDDEPAGLDVQVLDPGGQPHRGVASSHVAASLYPAPE